MDPELSRLFAGEREAATISVTLLVHGATIVGCPTHPGDWAEHVNDLVDSQESDHPELDPLAIAYLRQLPALDDEDPGHGFVTLRDVTLYAPNGHVISADYLRVDLERVAAWWLVSADEEE